MIVYNTEHFGFLLNLIYLRLGQHQDDESTLIVPESIGKEELLERLRVSKIFDKIIIHQKNIGFNIDNETTLKKRLVDYFDNLFEINEVKVETCSCIYTSHDCDNVFGLYLSLKGIHQTVIEMTPSQFDDELLYERTHNKGISSDAYYTLQKHEKILTGEGACCDRLRYASSEGRTISQLYIPKLTSTNRNQILSALVPGYKKLENRSIQLVIMNSKSFSRFIPLPECSKALVYQQLIDIVCDSNDDVMIKPHPEGITLANNNFPEDKLLDGNFPVETLLLDSKITIDKLISIKSMSSSFFKEEQCITLGKDFLTVVPYLDALYAIIRTVCKEFEVISIKQNLTKNNTIFKYLNQTNPGQSKKPVRINIVKTLGELPGSISHERNDITIIVNSPYQSLHRLSYDLKEEIVPLNTTITRTEIESIAVEGSLCTYVHSGNPDIIDWIRHIQREYVLPFSKKKLTLSQARTYESTTTYDAQLDMATENIKQRLMHMATDDIMKYCDVGNNYALDYLITKIKENDKEIEALKLQVLFLAAYYHKESSYSILFDALYTNPVEYNLSLSILVSRMRVSTKSGDQFRLGLALMDGIIMKKDRRTGLKLIKKAAENGNKRAQRYLKSFD